jgi:tRNA(Ile2) C34 agmatinyltransferase TiaS
MTTLLETPTARPVGEEQAEHRGLTLEERLDAVLDEVHADGRAECPVCGGGMEHAGSHARCGDCGSRLL